MSSRLQTVVFCINKDFLENLILLPNTFYNSPINNFIIL